MPSPSTISITKLTSSSPSPSLDRWQRSQYRIPTLSEAYRVMGEAMVPALRPPTNIGMAGTFDRDGGMGDGVGSIVEMEMVIVFNMS